MKLRHRFSGLVLLLAMGFALGAAPARALSSTNAMPVLSSAWEWLVHSWAEGLLGGRSLAHIFANVGAGSDPDGKPDTVATTNSGGGLSSLSAKEGMGSDPNGSPQVSARIRVLTGDAGAGSDPNGGH